MPVSIFILMLSSLTGHDLIWISKIVFHKSSYLNILKDELWNNHLLETLELRYILSRKSRLECSIHAFKESLRVDVNWNNLLADGMRYRWSIYNIQIANFESWVYIIVLARNASYCFNWRQVFNTKKKMVVGWLRTEHSVFSLIVSNSLLEPFGAF